MTDIDSMLKFDPLAEAEKVTGVRYSDKEAGEGFDNPATALGFRLMQDHAAAKERALTELGDTVFSNDLPRYRSIIESYGFQEVLADRWHSRWGNDETYFIFAHPKGLLLSFDTFYGDRVNGGKVYYNWRPADMERAWGCTSSGCMVSDDVWGGDHDCREALIHNITKLETNGTLITPWVKRPFLWLLHFDDSRVDGYDHAAITEARIKRLPQWVQDFIGPAQ